MGTIKNPILPGFHPDPSILRVGGDYYIATSTFEWFPGVQIHHSKDLVHWRLLTYALSRTTQLDMKGNPSSGGIWAPCLSYCNGLFYLIYTDVKSFNGIFKDTHNYLVTAKDIAGKWSEPVYLNSSGFDPSLFHDEDGRKWLLNMQWDHRTGRNRFAGILLQEYSPEEKKLVGKPVNIFSGTKLGLTEGPHLYKHDGFYYLVVAEGGTSLEHCVTAARSRKIEGPYETDPQNPILTSRYDCSLELQKAGHASLVETQNGEWYMAHLCGRPIPTKGRCVLGRETALQKMKWTADGWIRLEAGGNRPLTVIPAPELPEHRWPVEPVRDDFNSGGLNLQFQTLRVPLDENSLSLEERPGYLRLKGGESLNSLHTQSLVARRQQAFRYQAEACLEFTPESFQQMAGLICFYDPMNYYYLHVTHDEELGKVLGILTCRNRSCDYPVGGGIGIEGVERCCLRVTVEYDRLWFSYSQDGMAWRKIGNDLDASILSDEHYWLIGEERFTGAFVGICCQDLTGRRICADFDYFEYKEIL